MKTFTVYFEIYGKKLKSEVMALSEKSAKEIIKNKIIFHKLTEKREGSKDSFWSDEVKDLMDKLNGKK